MTAERKQTQQLIGFQKTLSVDKKILVAMSGLLFKSKASAKESLETKTDVYEKFNNDQSSVRLFWRGTPVKIKFFRNVST